jgi:DNA-binding NtrC family response regulator
MTKRIMIVDDEPDILLSLKIVLERQNYDVVTVTNGVECLREIEKGFKGIILMDLMMPFMDGWTTIKEIVKRGYMDDIAIAIITGKGTKDAQNMSLVGPYIFDYLPKPLDINLLLSSIERANRYFYHKNN